MNLYELSAKFAQLQELAENEEIDLEVLQDTLESIEGNIEEKFENIAKLLKNLNGNISIFKEEEKRLATKRKSMENKVDWLKDYLLLSLEMTGKAKVEAGLFNVRKQKNPDNITFPEGIKLPDKYLIPQEPKIDRATLKEDVLKHGVKIKGVEKAPETYHVRIS